MGKLSDLRMYIVRNGAEMPYMVNPYSVSDEDRPDFYREGKSRFKCSCGLLYELRHGDDALIPVTRKTDIIHDDTCPLSERYRHNEKALIFDPLKGKLIARVTGDISVRPDYSSAISDAPKKNLNGEHMSLSPFGLIRRINLISLYYEYEKKRASVLKDDTEHYFKYYLTEKFSKFVYSSAKTVSLSDKDAVICGTSLENDGYEFFYRPVRGLEISYRNKKGEKCIRLYDSRFSLDDLYSIARSAGVMDPEKRTKDTSALFIRLIFLEKDVSPLRVTFPALKNALRHLNASFTAWEIDFFSDEIIAAGWRYPDTDKDGNIKKSTTGKIFSVIDRLTLLKVNRYGIFTESEAEFRLTEKIIKMVNKSPDLMFFKPFVLTDDFYQGKWLPNGVLRVKGSDRDIIIEIFVSTRSNEYMDKIRLQESDKHIYLTWFPKKVSLNIFEEELGGVVKEVRQWVRYESRNPINISFSRDSLIRNPSGILKDRYRQ